MYLLRLKLYQPQAHYRVPFTYQRRHTYPLPPYSTVIGFLCNVMGIDWQGDLGGAPEDYKNLREIKISISGRFASKTTEYTWFRNLSKNSHIERFGSIDNRYVGGHIEHIGGQIPVPVDVLNEVYLVIHLAHKNKNFLEKVKQSLENPVNRLEIIHLGRAEDWVVFEEISEVVTLSDSYQIETRDGNFKYFLWIPEKLYMNGYTLTSIDKFEGLEYRITTFWKIQDFENTYNRHGQRIFEYIRVKLNDGLIVANKHYLFDKQINLPVFLADFGG